jgi:hypothetical protein
MNLKALYMDAVWESNELICTYKQQIKDEDLIGQAKTRALLKANKVILRQVYVDSEGYYHDTKNLIARLNADNYKKYRDEGQSQKDAENNAKLECYEFGDGKINLYEQMEDFNKKRKKSRGLLDDLTEIIIEISVNLKHAREEEQFN